MKEKKRLWKLYDALMARWDDIEVQADKLFEETHPWLFNPGMKPEIIETPETQEKEKQLARQKQHIFLKLQEVSVQLFPKKPVIITQQELL